MQDFLRTAVSLWDTIAISMLVSLTFIGFMAGLAVSAYRHASDRSKALNAWTLEAGLTDIQGAIAPWLSRVAQYRLTLIAMVIAIVVGLVVFRSTAWALRCASFVLLVVGVYEHLSLKRKALATATKLDLTNEVKTEPTFEVQTPDMVTPSVSKEALS